MLDKHRLIETRRVARATPKPSTLALRARLVIAMLLIAPLPAQAQTSSLVPWGGAAQIGAFVVDDRLGAALAAEWVLPLGTLEPERPGPGPSRVQVRRWSVVFGAASGPSFDFDTGSNRGSGGGDDVGFTLFGTSAVQHRLNGSLRAGLGLVGIVGAGRGLGVHLRGDYEGVVVVNAGWLDRAHHNDNGPFLAILLDWALLRDSGG